MAVQCYCFGGPQSECPCHLTTCPASWRLADGISHNNNLQVPTLQRHQAGHWVSCSQLFVLLEVQHQKKISP